MGRPYEGLILWAECRCGDRLERDYSVEPVQAVRAHLAGMLAKNGWRERDDRGYLCTECIEDSKQPAAVVAEDKTDKARERREER